MFVVFVFVAKKVFSKSWSFSSLLCSRRLILLFINPPGFNFMYGAIDPPALELRDSFALSLCHTFPLSSHCCISDLCEVTCPIGVIDLNSFNELSAFPCRPQDEKGSSISAHPWHNGLLWAKCHLEEIGDTYLTGNIHLGQPSSTFMPINPR